MSIRISAVAPPHRAAPGVLTSPLKALPLAPRVEGPLILQAVQPVPEVLDGPLHLRAETHWDAIANGVSHAPGLGPLRFLYPLWRDASSSQDQSVPPSLSI